MGRRAGGEDAGAAAQMYAVSQAVFGVGVGGEYPIASTSASERAEADRALHHRRGETVMLTFSMQGALPVQPPSLSPDPSFLLGPRSVVLQLHVDGIVFVLMCVTAFLLVGPSTAAPSSSPSPTSASLPQSVSLSRSLDAANACGARAGAQCLQHPCRHHHPTSPPFPARPTSLALSQPPSPLPLQDMQRAGGAQGGATGSTRRCWRFCWWRGGRPAALPTTPTASRRCFRTLPPPPLLLCALSPPSWRPRVSGDGAPSLCSCESGRPDAMPQWHNQRAPAHLGRIPHGATQSGFQRCRYLMFLPPHVLATPSAGRCRRSPSETSAAQAG